MDDTLATINTVITAARLAIDTLNSRLSKSKADKETLTLVTDIQSRLFQLQQVAFNLQTENAQLRAEISSKQDWTTEREKYEIVYLGQSPALMSKENPNVYVCPTCFEARNIVHLSKMPSIASVAGAGSHFCPKCNGLFGAK